MSAIDFTLVLEYLVEQHTLNGVLEGLKKVCLRRHEAAKAKGDFNASDWEDAAGCIQHTLVNWIPMDV